MHKLGCTHILASTCCGSLREDLAPGQFVLLDSFIDRTTKRAQTFHDQKSSNQSPEFGNVCHMAMHPSFCPETRCVNLTYQFTLALNLSIFHRKIIAKAAQAIGQDIKETGTMLTIEGPRFSSRAESIMFRAWGADVLNMTTCPEVVLAKELGISYAAIAMVTDYDCWRDDTQAVEAQDVMKVIAQNVDRVRKLFVEAVKAIGQEQWDDTIKANKVKFDSRHISILNCISVAGTGQK